MKSITSILRKAANRQKVAEEKTAARNLYLKSLSPKDRKIANALITGIYNQRSN